MKLTIDFNVTKSDLSISPSDELITIGSCFADEIGSHLKNDGFQILCNPFGVIFHPTAIANLLEKSLSSDFSTEITSVNDVYFSWQTSGKIFGYSEKEVKENFKNALIHLNEKLSRSRILIITFGTAIGFRHNKSNIIVGNCHKSAQNLTRKEFTPLEEMQLQWQKTIQQIEKRYPKLELIFTVSPTKHLKSGVIENVRSKARLIELVNSLNGRYFPSFEIIQEVLRDYRFYQSDGAHPSGQAVEMVYQTFMETYFSEEAHLFQKETHQYQTMKSHRFLYEKSQEALVFQEKITDLEKKLKLKYPFWKRE